MGDHEADIRTVRDFVSLRYQDRPTREALAALDRLHERAVAAEAERDHLRDLFNEAMAGNQRLRAERDRLREALEHIVADSEGLSRCNWEDLARAALSPECDLDHMTLTHGPGARCPSCGVSLTIPSPETER